MNTADVHPLYAALYVERWRPGRGWSAYVRPALQRMLASSWQVGGLEDDAVEDWLRLAIMLGDTKAAPLCLMLLEHLRSLLPPLVEHRGFEAHRDLCLMDLGLASSTGAEAVPLRDLGKAELMPRDEARITAWMTRQLQPFSGDLGRATELIVRLSAIRTGLLAGPDPATTEQVLDAGGWRVVD